MNSQFYQTPPPSRLMRFFWQASGADRYILERSTFSDQIKYSCMGGIVIATGVMAGMSGGYAFYTIFEPKGSALNTFKTVSEVAGTYQPTHLPTAFMAIIFGIIWGLIIFNIDRFIVTSTGKGDGTEAITTQELKSAIPRIIMGSIIALTISKPVEIRMFKSEIDVKLHEKQMEQQQAYKAKTEALFNTELAKKDKGIEKFEVDLQVKKQRYNDLEKNYIEEARIITVGPRALAVKAQMDALFSEIKQQEQNPDYRRLIVEKEAIEKDRTGALEVSEKHAAGLDGLLERIKIAHEISGFWISFFITALFMAIELTPIFFKLMLIKGPYDFIEENIKELIKAQNGIQIVNNYYQDKQGQERDLIINHHAKKIIEERAEILAAQQELNAYALEKWKEIEKSKIDANPQLYISTGEQIGEQEETPLIENA